MSPPRRVPGLAPPSFMPMTEVQLRRQMQEVLRSTACQAISFTLGSFTVDASLFEAVAAGLFTVDSSKPAQRWKGNQSVPATDFLPIQTNFFVKGGVSDGLVLLPNGRLGATVGGYQPGADTFIFPFTTIDGNASTAGTVVHECVHAGADTRRLQMPALDDEAAARLAKELYLYALQGKEYRPADTLAASFWIAAMASGAGTPTSFGSPPARGFQVPENVRLWLHGLLKSNGYDALEGKMNQADGTSPLGGKSLAVNTMPKH